MNECIARYGGLVWSLAKRRSPSTADAEDAVQEIFVDLWRCAGKFDEAIASEATFIVMIARRRLIDRQRKRGRQLDAVPLLTEDQPNAVEDGSRMELCEEARIAAQHLRELRPDERRVLELSIIHGWSHAKISAETGLPLGSVKTHARRGLLSLREKLRVKVRTPNGGGT